MSPRTLLLDDLEQPIEINRLPQNGNRVEPDC